MNSERLNALCALAREIEKEGRKHDSSRIDRETSNVQT